MKDLDDMNGSVGPCKAHDGFWISAESLNQAGSKLRRQGVVKGKTLGPGQCEIGVAGTTMSLYQTVNRVQVPHVVHVGQA